MNEKKTTKTWEISLFALNGISSNTAMFLIGYFMFYTQNVLGLSAVVVGFIATSMRIFDGITDPLIGVILDRTDTKLGRFRPFMLCGAIITSTMLFAIFNCPTSLSITGRYAYTTIFYALYIIGYTFQTTCTRAAQAILTKDPKQRPLFAVYNSGYNAVLNAIMPLILMTFLAPKFENGLANPALWRTMSLIVGAMIILLSLLACIGISKRDVKENYSNLSSEKVGFKDMWEVIRHNRALQMLIVAASTDKLAMSLGNGLTVYLFANCILNSSLQGTFSAMSVWPVLIISMGGIFLARKYGLKKPFLVSTWISMICFCLMFIIGAKPETTYLFLAVFLIKNCFVGITNNILNPMIADCADYEHYRSGKFVPGIVGTIFTFVDKIISSFASTFVGFALAFAGVANTQIPANQFISSKFYWTIMFCFCIVPIIGHVCSIVAMKFYPLTTEKMAEIQEKLKSMKEAA